MASLGAEASRAARQKRKSAPKVHFEPESDSVREVEQVESHSSPAPVRHLPVTSVHDPFLGGNEPDFSVAALCAELEEFAEHDAVTPLERSPQLEIPASVSPGSLAMIQPIGFAQPPSPGMFARPNSPALSAHPVTWKTVNYSGSFRQRMAKEVGAEKTARTTKPPSFIEVSESDGSSDESGGSCLCNCSTMAQRVGVEFGQSRLRVRP